MKEAEVSLRIAIFYIINNLTKKNVRVSIDGAHVKIKDNELFDIFKFMSDNGCRKSDGDFNRWQGEYEVIGFEPKIEICSRPGIGDVNIVLLNNETLYVESKKGANRDGAEYQLIREAVGQLMTAEYTENENVICAVAVPHTSKSGELAKRWSEHKKIKNANIHFILVRDNGDIKFI